MICPQHIHEEWRALPNTCYEVSSCGRVRRAVAGKGARLGHILKSGNCRGYRIVVLSHNGIEHTHAVHVLVALAFIGPRPSGADVAHEDGVRDHNCAANLHYKTRRDNEADKLRTGHLPKSYRMLRTLETITGVKLTTDRTHCINGHELNTATAYYKGGRIRYCRICVSASRERYRSKYGN